MASAAEMKFYLFRIDLVLGLFESFHKIMKKPSSTYLVLGFELTKVSIMSHLPLYHQTKKK